MAYDAGLPKDRSGQHARAKKWRDRSNACFLIQQRFLPLWQAQAEIFYPEMATFQTEQPDPTTIYDGLFTSKPQVLSRTLGERIGSMTRAKGEPWFKLTAQPEELMDLDDVKSWCEDATKRQRNVLYAATSGFAVAMGLADRDYATFGNAVTRYAYNKDRSGIYFSAVHLRDCAWAENAEGIIDEMHEKMRPTLAQVRDMFGIDNLPAEWRKKLDDPKLIHEKVDIRRCVGPLDDLSYGEKEKPRLKAKFVSCYMACGADIKDDECCLAEGFLDSFPYSVRRWMRLPGEVYARSPAMGIALADGRTLNIAEMALLKGIELKVSPPRVAIDDTVSGIRLEADGITFISADYDQRTGDPIQTLEVGDPSYGMDFVDRKASELAKACFMDLLQMPDREMTLGEFRQRFKNALRDAAPVFEPIEADYAQLMDGVFDLCLNAMGPARPWGVFLEAPEALSPDNGAQVRYEFQTALSEAFTELARQEALDVMAQAQLLKDMESDAIDHIDMGQVTRDSLGNFKAKWTRPEKDVEKMREARNQAQEEAQAKEDAMAVAATASKTNPENLRMLKTEMEGAA